VSVAGWARQRSLRIYKINPVSIGSCRSLQDHQKEIKQMPLTVAELMEKMPGAFIPEKAQGVDADIQFHFTGAEPGEWVAAIRDGRVEVARGTHPSPKMTLTADSSDYVKIFTGELDGMQAFMQGKIKLAGDLNLAMKLMQMFKIR
jgi:putative sterol carrier protein